MKDIEHNMRADLQALLDENPHLEPTAMLDGGQVATMTIVDGVPRITRDPMPETFNYDLPDVADMHGTPVYRIYHILKALNIFEEENKAMAAATAQMQAARVPAEEGVRIDPPTMPTTPEVVVSTVSGNTSLRNQEDKHGMYRHLESLQAQLRTILAKNPELDTIIIKTARENVEVSTSGGEIRVLSTASAGQDYMQVRNTPQAHLLQMTRTIRGLEEKLYGSSACIHVAKAPVKISPSDNLAQLLDEVECGNLAIHIRSRKKTLYLSGTEKVISYRGTQTSLEDGKLVDEDENSEPTGYMQVEYGALPKPVAAVLQAYWAYISPKRVNQKAQ
jgi:hypothetical protein